MVSENPSVGFILDWKLLKNFQSEQIIWSIKNTDKKKLWILFHEEGMFLWLCQHDTHGKCV